MTIYSADGLGFTVAGSEFVIKTGSEFVNKVSYPT